MSTILSGGIALLHILETSETVMEMTGGKIFPVYTQEAETPYIAYSMSGLDEAAVKTGRGAFTANFDVIVYASTYETSCALAEAVLEALDGWSGTVGDMTVRSCMLIGAEEYWTGDAFAKTLSIRIKI